MARQRLRCGPEQDIVDHGLVMKRDGCDLIRHREHDMEVGHVEQFRLTVLQPLGAGQTLALWAVPVAAGNGNFPLALSYSLLRHSFCLTAG